MTNTELKTAEVRRLAEKYVPAMQTMAWTPNEVVDAVVMDLYGSHVNDYPNHETEAELFDLTTSILDNEQRWERNAA